MLSMRLNKIIAAGALTILNLHRIDFHNVSAYPAMPPAIFDDLVGYLKQRFQILTFRDLAKLPSQEKPGLVLSFDDGYKDFIDVVVPILDKHRIAANQNVIPGCVARGLPPMNVMLQDFIGSAPATLLREIDTPIFCGLINADDRVRSGQRASAALKKMPQTEQRTIFEQLQTIFDRFDGFRTTPMMSVSEIRQITHIHQIGAHSFDHATMTAETDAYLIDDVTRCRNWFEATLSMSPEIYAFPNGAARTGQIRLVTEAGYSHVLVVGERFSSLVAKAHTRFTIHADTLHEARFRAFGGFSPIDASLPIAG
jgi:peptidoglycan/xylan/chitin deacetylase (PgdA/CDA1 family)